MIRCKSNREAEDDIKRIPLRRGIPDPKRLPYRRGGICCRLSLIISYIYRSVELDAVAGVVEAISLCGIGGVVGEGASLVGASVEVHREEVLYLDLVEEDPCATGKVGAWRGSTASMAMNISGLSLATRSTIFMKAALASSTSLMVDSSCQCQSLRSPPWNIFRPSGRVTRKLTPASVDP